MLIYRVFGIAALSALSGCAVSETPNPFTAQRTVFYNPYEAPELQNGPVGPDQCADCLTRDGRWLEGLVYPGRGRYAFDKAGNRVRLTQDDRRELRRRFNLIQDQIEINRRVAEFSAMQAAFPDVPPPVPTAPPTALGAPSTPAPVVSPPVSAPVSTPAPAARNSNGRIEP